MKRFLYIVRLLVGVLFIVSGLIKANDPLGFSYKLGEYFAPDVLGWTIFENCALELAILICVGEIVLGFATLFGVRMKLATWSLLLMIVFFTFLTFYSAYFDKVRECGCFGDALKMTPWQSFGKDVVLLVLIMILFIWQRKIEASTLGEDVLTLVAGGGLTALFCLVVLHIPWAFPIWFFLLVYIVLMLLKNMMHKASKDWIMAGVAALLSIGFSIYCVRYLPVKDFRPFAEGKNIAEGIKLPEGAQPDVFETILTYKDVRTGEQKDFTTNNYPWDDTLNWKWISTENRLVKEGDHPTIEDFELTDADGVVLTEDVLNEPVVLLMVSKDLASGNFEEIGRINQLAGAMFAAGYSFYGVTSSSVEACTAFTETNKADFDFLICDHITLKTMIRSNPGLVLLKKGLVVKKWSVHELPGVGEINAMLKVQEG